MVFFRRKHIFFLFFVTTCILLSFSLDLYTKTYAKTQSVLGIRKSNIPLTTQTPTYMPTHPLVTTTPIPSSTPTPTPTKKPTSTITPTLTLSNSSQYTAQKIGSNTWQVSNIQTDSQMASPRDIYNALNSYRGSHGVSTLNWDNSLVSYAQSRADTYAANGSLDNHAGFISFMNNDGFNKIGFMGLGENAAYLAGPMSGDKIIKDIFGADSAHDGNQLDPSWQYVGVGVNGKAVNVNFGKNKK